MFKSVSNQVCAFDLEWVPDAQSGRRAYDLPAHMADIDVFQVMWDKAGATAENPRPYLKTALCRIVSVAAVIRVKSGNGDVKLRLSGLPKQPQQGTTEADLIATFLGYVGQAKPQLVGFNSATSDLPILLQRGMATGITAADFCRRPQKPWDGIDYFTRHGDAHVDLKTLVSGYGIGTPSLHELASALGIPGKMGTDGSSVVDLWVAGDLQRIVEYNQFDALTTYLVWLRTAKFAGFFTPEQYQIEEDRVKALLADNIAQGQLHLATYLEKWQALQQTEVVSGAAVLPGPATVLEQAA